MRRPSVGLAAKGNRRRDMGERMSLSNIEKRSQKRFGAARVAGCSPRSRSSEKGYVAPV